MKFNLISDSSNNIVCTHKHPSVLSIFLICIKSIHSLGFYIEYKQVYSGETFKAKSGSLKECSDPFSF